MQIYGKNAFFNKAHALIYLSFSRIWIVHLTWKRGASVNKEDACEKCPPEKQHEQSEFQQFQKLKEENESLEIITLDVFNTTYRYHEAEC